MGRHRQAKAAPSVRQGWRRFIACPCCWQLADLEKFKTPREFVAKMRLAGGYKGIRWTTGPVSDAERQVVDGAVRRAATLTRPAK